MSLTVCVRNYTPCKYAQTRAEKYVSKLVVLEKGEIIISVVQIATNAAMAG
jgi:hypothetical protein